MATTRIIETMGSISKVEKLKTLDNNILENTLVLEEIEPFPGYHGANLPTGYNPRAIRFLLISTHYRKLLNFTFKELEAAATSLERIDNFLFMLSNLEAEKGNNSEISELIQTNEKQFQETMDNDLNISGGLGTLFDFISEINKNQDQLKVDNLTDILNYLKRIDSVLGVIKFKTNDSIDQEIETLIAKRNQARKDKNYPLSDQIRDQLKNQGITLIDTPSGTKWKKS